MDQDPPPASPPAAPPRGSGLPVSGWGDKNNEIRRKLPVYRRTWWRRLMLGGAIAAGLAAAVGLWQLNRWHAEHRAAIETERHHLARFLASDDFTGFAQAAEMQFVAVLNFVVAHPESARTALPTVAAWEKAHGELPWALQLAALPVSSAAQPARIYASGRTATTLLAQHGFAWDDTTYRAGRKLMLRLLLPYARDFVTRFPEYGLREIWTEPTLQDQVFVALGTRAGSVTPRADAERLFAFYAQCGPAMWDRIEATAPAGAPPH